jgi:hypothetical protein
VGGLTGSSSRRGSRIGSKELGVETGRSNAGPSTTALTFTLAHLDSPKTVGKAALLAFLNRNGFASCQDWRVIIDRQYRTSCLREPPFIPATGLHFPGKSRSISAFAPPRGFFCLMTKGIARMLRVHKALSQWSDRSL